MKDNMKRREKESDSRRGIGSDEKGEDARKIYLSLKRKGNRKK